MGALSATKRLARVPEVLMAQIKVESEQFAARLTTVEAREGFHGVSPNASTAGLSETLRKLTAAKS